MDTIPQKKSRHNYLAYAILFLIIVNVYLAYSQNYMKKQYFVLKDDYNSCSQENDALSQGVFKLVNQSAAFKDVETFLRLRKDREDSYAELEQKIIRKINQSSGTYGFYFENLDTGAWMGYNEQAEFLPASLLKVPVAMAILKKVEEGSLGLNQIYTLREEDINVLSGELGLKGAGYQLTVKDLLVIMIKESDNTAQFALINMLSDDEYNAALERTGLCISYLSAPDVQVSPRKYSRILKTLYYSNFLKRPFSNLLLSIMLDTDFNNQIPSQLPKNVNISHKVGFYIDGNYNHDCGIVYLEKSHYILCMMSQNATKYDSQEVIGSVSRMIYDYESKR